MTLLIKYHPRLADACELLLIDMADRDPWYYPRAELSDELFRMFGTGLVRRVAMFAPRRKGKTWFLIRDLAPAAVRRKFIPVYASLWAAPDAPHAPIIDAAVSGVEAASARRTPWKRYLERLQSVALNAGVVSTSWAVGAKDPTPATEDNLGRLAKALAALARSAPNGQVLLMLDEAQHLATDRRFDGLTHCLRTALDTIEAGGATKFHTLFTGSSRTNLTRLLNDKGAPFYRSVEQIDLPDLDRGYTEFVVTQLKRYRGLKSLDRNRCWEVFNALDRSPFYMEVVIRSLMLRRANTLDEGFEYALAQLTNDPELSARWRGLRQIDQIIYGSICVGDAIYSEDAQKRYSIATGHTVDVATIQNSVRRLRRLGLVSSSARGRYRNEDPELLLWARRNDYVPE